jgi:hypothetical protein
MTALLVGAILLATIQAQQFTERDTHTAVAAAAHERGVSERLLDCMVFHESTYDPYALGARGELGAAQLHPRGRLADFYARGYLNPFNPYQAVDYLAAALTEGDGAAWSSYAVCRA